MRRRGRLGAAVVAMLLVGAVGAPPARADSVGWNLGSALSTLVYAPVKVAYAAAGLVVGGIGWGLSGGNRTVMEAVVTPAVRGDYWVTPAHLRGERQLVFVGSAPPVGAPPREVAAPREPEERPGDAYWGY